MLVKHRQNHIIEKNGIVFKVPDWTRELRELDWLYKVLANENNPEEAKACAIIINRPQSCEMFVAIR